MDLHLREQTAGLMAAAGETLADVGRVCLFQFETKKINLNFFISGAIIKISRECFLAVKYCYEVNFSPSTNGGTELTDTLERQSRCDIHLLATLRARRMIVAACNATDGIPVLCAYDHSVTVTNDSAMW